MRLEQATEAELREWEAALAEKYRRFQEAGLSLDLTRGKPCPEQLELSRELDGILGGDYRDANGKDMRNYGGLDGIPEAKALFCQVLEVAPADILIGGNSSLTLMYNTVECALRYGISGPDSAWNKAQEPIKFLAPVPGYDRHFKVCQHLGIELLPITMGDNGPDMDAAEALVTQDPLIKGIWCVPRFSNPTGAVYADEVVRRMAALPKIAGSNFMIFWDNAYAMHIIDEDAPRLASLWAAAQVEGTENNVLIFGSTSKMTFAGAGVAFMACSEANRAGLIAHAGFSSIGPDKVNQLRHVKLLKDLDGISAHMARHAALIKPRFDAVLSMLQQQLGDSGMGSWTKPKGGYFISFDTLDGLASEVVKLAAKAGVQLTPAGAPFPGGKDSRDSNIRIAPTFPSVEDIRDAMEVFVVCVKLASVRKKLAA